MQMFNCPFAVTTVYPVEEFGMNTAESEDTTMQTHGEDIAPTSFPTVAAIENSLETSTVNQPTHTFVPFIPNVLPEVTVSENPEVASVEYTEGTAEEPSDIIAVETLTEREENTEAEPGSRGGAEPEEQASDGKANSHCFFKSRMLFSQSRRVYVFKVY